MAIPAPAAKAALAQATALWPARNRASDGICGDAAHRATTSDHNPDADGLCCAFDLTHDPAHGCDAHTLAEQLRRRRDPRVKYLISNGRIASPPSWVWRPYSGANPHRSHAHVSISQAGKRDTAPWWALPTPVPPVPDARTETVPIPVHDYEEAATKTTMVHIGKLDAAGCGHADWQPGLGRDPIIVGVVQHGPSPADDGYWMHQANVNLSAQPRGGAVRVTVRNGQAGDTVTAWVTVA